MGPCSEIGSRVEPLFEFLTNEIEPVINRKKSEIDAKMKRLHRVMAMKRGVMKEREFN